MPDSNRNFLPTAAARLGDELSQWTQSLLAFGAALRCSMPAIVVSFNAAQQTVVVKPAITRNIVQAGELISVAWPNLVDVPISIPRAGGFTLTLPIAAGDECWVIFGDGDIGGWFQSGGVQNQIHERSHTLADAVALMGVWSQPRVLAGYSTASAQLRNDAGTVVIDVAGSAVTVTAPTVNVTAQTANFAGSTAVNITGGHCTVDGRNFLLHTHSGVASGGASSGPVV